MTFLVMTMAIVEYHSSALVQHEIAVESVSEIENIESESVADTADLVRNSTLTGGCCKSLSFPDKGFIFFTLSQDIFKPPRFA